MVLSLSSWCFLLFFIAEFFFISKTVFKEMVSTDLNYCGLIANNQTFTFKNTVFTVLFNSLDPIVIKVGVLSEKDLQNIVFSVESIPSSLSQKPAPTLHNVKVLPTLPGFKNVIDECRLYLETNQSLKRNDNCCLGALLLYCQQGNGKSTLANNIAYSIPGNTCKSF